MLPKLPTHKGVSTPLPPPILPMTKDIRSHKTDVAIL